MPYHFCDTVTAGPTRSFWVSTTVANRDIPRADGLDYSHGETTIFEDRATDPSGRDMRKRTVDSRVVATYGTDPHVDATSDAYRQMAECGHYATVNALRFMTGGMSL